MGLSHQTLLIDLIVAWAKGKQGTDMRSASKAHGNTTARMSYAR
jgi:hypothetical protein